MDIIDLSADAVAEALAARCHIFQVPAALLITEAGTPVVSWHHLPFPVEILEEVEARA